jgi:ABC-type nickel/cobalt efflux system permease component RcnA
MSRIIYLLIILSLFVPQLLSANPITSGKKSKVSQLEKSTLKTHPKLVQTQRNIYRKMMKNIRSYKKDRSWNVLMLLIGIAFLYGILHALGPGHGKLFTGSYLLGNNAGYRTGMMLGFGSGALHAVTGLAIVLIFRLILNSAGRQFTDQYTEVGQVISYVVILLVGLYLLLSTIRGHSHEHTSKSFWGILLSVGLIPCPGVILISSFTIMHDMTMTGILMIIGMATGMGIAITMSNSLILIMRETIFTVLGKFKWVEFLLGKLFPLLGAILLMILGLGLLIGRVL